MAFTSSSPSAKVTDGRLVLTLPDAETPALWVMDLNEAAASVIRLESDRQGFYVLKKHSGKGAAETIAVYRDRNRADRAINKASKALEKARGSLRGGNTGGFSRAGRIFIYFVMFWALLWMTGFDRLLLRAIVTPFYKPQELSAEQQQELMKQGYMPTPDMQAQQAAPQAAIPQASTPQAGVPMSADDYLKQPR